MGLGLEMEQAGLAKSFGPIIAPQNHLPDSSDREEDFDVLGPTSWPVKSCFLMGVRGSFVYPWRAPDASVYEVHCHQCFLFGDNVDCFDIRNVYSMAPL